MLSRLRVIFDDPLFVRTQHGLLPTPRAEALAPALQRLIDDATALVSPEIFDPQTSDATITISTNDYMQSVLAVPLIAKLRQLAPGMRVGVRNLEVVELTEKLARGDIDMAITTPEFIDTALNTAFLYREEYVAVVRKKHPIRTRRPSLKQFLSYDHVLMSPSEGSFSGPADEATAALGANRRVALSVPGFSLLVEVLQEDDFIAFMPKRLVARYTEILRSISAPIQMPGFDVIVAWHPRTDVEPVHVWLREMLGNLS
jgi:DNA-binding transcriptional LysR family regulator